MTRNTVPDAEFVRLAGLLSCVEMAEVLEISPAAISQRVARLRAKGLLPNVSHRWRKPYCRPQLDQRLASGV